MVTDRDEASAADPEVAEADVLLEPGEELLDLAEPPEAEDAEQAVGGALPDLAGDEVGQALERDRRRHVHDEERRQVPAQAPPVSANWQSGKAKNDSEEEQQPIFNQGPFFLLITAQFSLGRLHSGVRPIGLESWVLGLYLFFFYYFFYQTCSVDYLMAWLDTFMHHIFSCSKSEVIFLGKQICFFPPKISSESIISRLMGPMLLSAKSAGTVLVAASC